ncbi:helicase HerA domain-containing protein [Clostridium botulinum]|uniref:helicase HerA domain-containing protein n=1 Tax=Clostridium botulinum TaxID=1491 RepID=UPI003DA58E06
MKKSVEKGAKEKEQALREYLRGREQVLREYLGVKLNPIIVDPTDEYKHSSEMLGVEIIQINSNEAFTFNPFELNSNIELENMNTRFNTIIELIECIYEKDLSKPQRYLINRYLKELYIDYNPDNIPTLLSFGDLLKKKNKNELEDLLSALEQYLGNNSSINFEV